MNRRTASVRLLGTAIALFGIAQFGPAPIMGQKLGLKPHTNLQPQDEKALESQQHPIHVDQIGEVSDGKKATPVAASVDEQGASDVMGAAAQRTSGALASSDANSQAVFNEASRRSGQSGGRSWVWALVVIGGVLAGVFGVKRWADNNIPGLPETATPKRDSW